MSTTISKKHFKWMRAFGIFALVCTILVFLFVTVESSLSTEKSAQISSLVSNLFRPAYDTIDTTPDVIKVRALTINALGYKTGDAYFVGDQYQLTVDFSPKGAEPESYHFEVEEADETKTVEIDENGLLTIVAMGKADTKVYAVLDSDPSVKSRALRFRAHGTTRPNEDTEYVHDLRRESETVGTEENPLVVGQKATFYLTDDTGARAGLFFYESSNTNVAKTTSANVYAVGEGTATIRAWFEYKGMSWEYFYEVHVKEAPPVTPDPDNPDNPNPPAPEVIIPEAIFANASIHVEVGEHFYFRDLDLSFFPADSVKDVEITASTDEYAENKENWLTARDAGTYTLTISSLYDPSISTTVTVVITRPEVEYIDINTDSTVSIYDNAKLNAYVGPKYADDEIVWTVVKGKATIDEDGKLQPEMLGHVTVRATSVANPEVYTEKTFKVSLFSDFASFARKIMGHFLIFAVLGLGFMATYYFLAKRKYLAPLFALLSGFGTACLSELLQKFAEGRFSTMTDVMLDTMGVMTGMGFGMIVVGIVCGLWRAISDKSFHKIALAYRSLNFTNMFKSNETINMLFSADVYNRDPNQHKIDTSPDNPQEQSELPADN